MHISLLNDDFTKPAGKYARVLVNQTREAPALMKHRGKYYLFTSGCTGWSPNPASVCVADSIYGPYTDLGNPWQGPASAVETSYNSQSTYILPVQGRPRAFIFMADRWCATNAIDGRYVWAPIEWKDGRPVLNWRDQWDLAIFDKPEFHSPYVK